MRLRKTPRVLREEPGTRRILAVSDIHGDRDLFLRLLEKLSYRPGQDALVLIGDYVNRGPQSLDTVRAVMELAREKNVFVLRGNNDVFLAQGQPEHILENLRYFGERCLLGELLRDAGLPQPDTPADVPGLVEGAFAAFPAETDFLLGLPDILETERFLFAHAGLESEELEAQDLGFVLSTPRFHETGTYRFSKLLLVGHWPTANYRTDRLSNAPIYNERTHVLSIDGGNRVKRIGQLNGIVLDNDDSSWTWDSADFLPEIAAPVSQRERAGVVVTWPENFVEVLRRGEPLSLCRDRKTGTVLEIPTAYLYEDGGETRTGDVTNRRLAVEKGEPLGLLGDFGSLLLIRKNGEAGLLILKDELS